MKLQFFAVFFVFYFVRPTSTSARMNEQSQRNEIGWWQRCFSCFFFKLLKWQWRAHRHTWIWEWVQGLVGRLVRTFRLVVLLRWRCIWHVSVVRNGMRTILSGRKFNWKSCYEQFEQKTREKYELNGRVGRVFFLFSVRVFHSNARLQVVLLFNLPIAVVGATSPVGHFAEEQQKKKQ